MRSCFKNILIPIEHVINSDVLVNKALQLADGDTTIHLLYVESNGINKVFTSVLKFITRRRKFSHGDIERKMDDLKFMIGKKDIKVTNRHIIDSSIQKAIQSAAQQLDVDLIILGKNAYRSILPFFNKVVSSLLDKKTGIPVLTISPGAMDNKIRKIVIPIMADGSLQLKMDIISNLCKKFKLNIHLLTFTKQDQDVEDKNVSSFLKAYKCLKLYNHCNVEYAVLYDLNKAKAILKYSEKIQADILIVHPGSETKTGWPYKNITDMVPAASRMQVLAV